MNPKRRFFCFVRMSFGHPFSVYDLEFLDDFGSTIQTSASNIGAKRLCTACNALPELRRGRDRPYEQSSILTRGTIVHRGESNAFFRHRFRLRSGGVSSLYAGLRRRRLLPPATSSKTSRHISRALNDCLFGLGCDA